jgi:hypothetical protein
MIDAEGWEKRCLPYGSNEPHNTIVPQGRDAQARVQSWMRFSSELIIFLDRLKERDA